MTDRPPLQEPPHERQPFCVQCGLVDKIDRFDGACGYCGGDTCGLDQLRELLAVRGLRVVADDRLPDAERAEAVRLGREFWAEVDQGLVRPTEQAVIQAAEAFFDVRHVQDDDRAFEGLMTAVAALRKAREAQ